MYRFGIVGTGWRSLFYLRAARACPERFEISGVVTRDPQGAVDLSERFGISLYASCEELVEREAPDFVVLLLRRREDSDGSPEFGLEAADFRRRREPFSSDLDEPLFEDRLGSIRVFSQYGQTFQSSPTGLEQLGQGFFSLVRQFVHLMKSGPAGAPHFRQELALWCRRRASVSLTSRSRSRVSSRNSPGRTIV